MPLRQSDHHSQSVHRPNSSSSAENPSRKVKVNGTNRTAPSSNYRIHSPEDSHISSSHHGSKRALLRAKRCHRTGQCSVQPFTTELDPRISRAMRISSRFVRTITSHRIKPNDQPPAITLFTTVPELEIRSSTDDEHNRTPESIRSCSSNADSLAYLLLQRNRTFFSS